MPALFAYLLAVSLLLGGGYVSLHWLAAPGDAPTSQRPHQSKSQPASKDVDEKSAAQARTTRAENRSGDDSETEITASSATSGASNKASTAAPRNGTAGTDDTNVQAKQTEGVSPGACMPIGLTAQGELVFPMQCQELIEQHRGPVASQDPVATNSIPASPPNERQAAEPARPADDEEQSPGNRANARVEDVSPSRQAKPGNENSQSESIKERKVGRRNIQSSHSRDEAQWFNPLTFR
jgi:hypothetical protein